ncbi:hypothetical protein SZ64_00810 [Erythrobacter sp. SG61-1L]|uniref:BA14K family protein n=1 Tax=Erythrobacter sp. SG61-1L TaxID=1603897 RepID=UPI0006C917EF|nr:BA14K family protein [Erythrobacter sp. SG61-1L]KPL66769.1 hypothetical protein SZ64_00810 [Erythrobacter sp. SG61-1L]
MRNFLAPLFAAALLTIAPQALQAQPKPAEPPRKEGQAKPQPQPTQKPAAKKEAPKQGPSSKSPYGEWKSAWGKAPPAPPKHWTKTNDWHRHVRACQQRYKSYNAKTDTYRTQSGKRPRCKL